MTSVTVSAHYRVTIPQNIHEALGIKPGQKLAVLRYQDRILLIPIMSMDAARGFLKGIDTTIERQTDRF